MNRLRKTLSPLANERGQMLLGGLFFLLLSALVSIALLRLAFEDVAALEELDATRDALLEEGSQQAARLNEFSINQSLVLWHLAGALRAHLEFAEGTLLAAATRSRFDTGERPSALEKAPAYARYRNALSLRSSRHFAAAGLLLERNADILAAVEVRSPGFRATLRETPVGAVFCALGQRWGSRQALAFPLLELLTRAFAGGAAFTFVAQRCAFALDGPTLGFPQGQGEELVALDTAWEAFAVERREQGRPTPPLFFPRPQAHVAWGEILRLNTRSPRSRMRIDVVCEHPASDAAAALLVPSWAAFLAEVRRDAAR